MVELLNVAIIDSKSSIREEVGTNGDSMYFIFARFTLNLPELTVKQAQSIVELSNMKELVRDEIKKLLPDEQYVMKVLTASNRNESAHVRMDLVSKSNKKHGRCLELYARLSEVQLNAIVSSTEDGYNLNVCKSSYIDFHFEKERK